MNRKKMFFISTIQAWSKPRPAFHAFVSIRHVESGLYLAVIPPSGSTILSSTCLPEACIFGLWLRQGKHGITGTGGNGTNKNENNNHVVGLFGLLHQTTKRWLGQSYFTGTLSCSATQMGQREEWEVSLIPCSPLKNKRLTLKFFLCYYN